MNNTQNLNGDEPRFRMPAEWSDHSGTMLIWPHNRNTWPGDRLDNVEKVYSTIVRTLLNYEPVLLFVNDETVRKRAMNKLGNTKSLPHTLKIIKAPVNDMWARDSGPIYVKDLNDGRFKITDWEFNSWGGKYPPWSDDNRLPETISELSSAPCYKTGMVLEGGSIETNGEGLFLTTESVLLNPNRNPTMSRDGIENMLEKFLGAEKVIWLNRGLQGDDTDGHIDDLTRFVNKNTVITTVTSDETDPNYEALQENLETLQSSTDQTGNPLHIIQVPLPDTIVDSPTVDGSDHVPSSYANFYIANGVVVLPLYDEATDQSLLDLFSNLFPGRVIEGIPCSDLVWGQGSIHCITQQLYGHEFAR